VPSSSFNYGSVWLDRFENAQEVTGACFDIYEETAGYLGLGPCGIDWLPQRSWYTFIEPWTPEPRGCCNPQIPLWIWLREVWYSPDAKTWEQMTGEFFDSTAAVMAEPYAVAERDGRWVVIGATGVSQEADAPWEDRTLSERVVLSSSDADIGGLWVPKSAEPAAWVADNLAEWAPLGVDFTKPGTNTQLTTVAAGKPGWVIFGIRTSHEDPTAKEWVGWASTDGIGWEELPMAGVYDDPCQYSETGRCGGSIKAFLQEDVIVAWAWTWTLSPASRGWRLLLGTF
jgi:hypothetical protein